MSKKHPFQKFLKDCDACREAQRFVAECGGTFEESYQRVGLKHKGWLQWLYTRVVSDPMTTPNAKEAYFFLYRKITRKQLEEWKAEYRQAITQGLVNNNAL